MVAGMLGGVLSSLPNQRYIFSARAIQRRFFPRRHPTALVIFSTRNFQLNETLTPMESLFNKNESIINWTMVYTHNECRTKACFEQKNQIRSIEGELERRVIKHFLPSFDPHSDFMCHWQNVRNFRSYFWTKCKVNFEPIFEQNVNFGPILEKNANFGPIFVWFSSSCVIELVAKPGCF